MEPDDPILPVPSSQPNFAFQSLPTQYSTINARVGGAEDTSIGTIYRHESYSPPQGEHSKHVGDTSSWRTEYPVTLPLSGHRHHRWSSWWDTLFSSNKHTSGKHISALNARSRRLQRERRRIWYVRSARLAVLILLFLLLWGSFRLLNYIFLSSSRVNEEDSLFANSWRKKNSSPSDYNVSTRPLNTSDLSSQGEEDHRKRNNTDLKRESKKKNEEKEKNSYTTPGALPDSLLTPFPVWNNYPGSAKIRHLLRALRRGRKVEDTIRYLYTSSAEDTNALGQIAEEERGVEMGSIPLTWMAQWWWLATQSYSTKKQAEKVVHPPPKGRAGVPLNGGRDRSSSFSIQFPWQYVGDTNSLDSHKKSSFFFPPPFYEEWEDDASVFEEQDVALLGSFRSLLGRKVTQWAKEDSEQATSWKPLLKVVELHPPETRRKKMSPVPPLPSRRLITFIPWASTVSEDLLITEAPYHNRLVVYGVLPYRRGSQQEHSAPIPNEKKEVLGNELLQQEESHDNGNGNEWELEEDRSAAAFYKKSVEGNDEDDTKKEKNSVQRISPRAGVYSESRGGRASSASSKIGRRTSANKFVLSKLWAAPHLPSSSSPPAWIVSAIAADILGNGAVDIVVQSSDGQLYVLPDSRGLAREEYENVKEMKKNKRAAGSEQAEKLSKKKRSRQMRKVILSPTPRESADIPSLSLQMKDPLQPMLTAAALSSPSSISSAHSMRPADLLYVNDKGELLLLSFHGAHSSSLLHQNKTEGGEMREEEEVEYYYNVTSLVPGIREGHREVLPFSILQADVNGDCAAELVYGVRDTDRKKLEVYVILAPPMESEEELHQQQQRKSRKQGGDEQQQQYEEEGKNKNDAFLHLSSYLDEKNHFEQDTSVGNWNPYRKTGNGDDSRSTGGRYEVDPQETTPWMAAWFPVSLASTSTPSSHRLPEILSSSFPLRHYLLLELDETDVRYGHLTFADVDGDGFVDLLLPYAKVEEIEEEVLLTLFQQKGTNNKHHKKKKSVSEGRNASGISSSESPRSPSSFASFSSPRVDFASSSSIDGIRVFYNLATGPASFSAYESAKKEKNKKANLRDANLETNDVRGPSAACLPAYHGRLHPFNPYNRHRATPSEEFSSRNPAENPHHDQNAVSQEKAESSSALERKKKLQVEYNREDEENSSRIFDENQMKFSSSSSFLFANEWHFGFSEAVSAIMPLNAATCGLFSAFHSSSEDPVSSPKREDQRFLNPDNTDVSASRSQEKRVEQLSPRILVPQLLRTGDYNRDGQADILLSSNVGPLLLTSIRRSGVLGRQRPPLFLSPLNQQGTFSRGNGDYPEKGSKVEDKKVAWWERLKQIIRDSSSEDLMANEMLEEDEIMKYMSSSTFSTDMTWKSLTEVFPFRCTPLDAEKAGALLRAAQEEEKHAYRVIVSKEKGVQQGQAMGGSSDGDDNGGAFHRRRIGKGESRVRNTMMKDWKSKHLQPSSIQKEESSSGEDSKEENQEKEEIRMTETGNYAPWTSTSHSLQLYKDSTAFFRTGSQPGELYIGLTVLQLPSSSPIAEDTQERHDILFDANLQGEDRNREQNDVGDPSGQNWFALYEPPEYQHEHYYLLLSAVSPLTHSPTASSSASSAMWNSEDPLKSVGSSTRSSSSSYYSWYGAPSIGLVHHLFWHNKDMQPQEAFVTQLPRCNGFSFSPFQVLVGLGETFSYAHHYMVGRRGFSYRSLHEAGAARMVKPVDKAVRRSNTKKETVQTSLPSSWLSRPVVKDEVSQSFSSTSLPLVHLSTREWPIFLVPNSQVFALMHSRQSAKSIKKKRRVFPSFRKKSKGKSSPIAKLEGMQSLENITELSPFIVSPDFPEEWAVVLYMPVQKYRRRLFTTLLLSLIFIGFPIIYIRWREWRQDEMEWRNR